MTSSASFWSRLCTSGYCVMMAMKAYVARVVVLIPGKEPRAGLARVKVTPTCEQWRLWWAQGLRRDSEILTACDPTWVKGACKDHMHLRDIWGILFYPGVTRKDFLSIQTFGTRTPPLDFFPKPWPELSDPWIYSCQVPMITT